jgi:hypothetical protein
MNELRSYLEALLDHQCAPSPGECRECRSLQRIYQFMQAELFSTVIYTETPLEPRHPAQSPSRPVNRVAASPLRPPAGRMS